MATTIIDNLRTSRGIFVDNQNNIFVSDWNLIAGNFTNSFASSIKKFSQSGSPPNAVLIGNDSVTAKFAKLPNSNNFIGLKEDGKLILTNPDSLSVNLIADLRSLPGVETSSPSG